MSNHVMKPHTAMFVGTTWCGKTELVLKLLETSYKEYFEYIIIICPHIKIELGLQVIEKYF